MTQGALGARGPAGEGCRRQGEGSAKAPRWRGQGRARGQSLAAGRGTSKLFFFFNKTQTLNIVSFVAARSHFPTPPRVLNE